MGNIVLLYKCLEVNMKIILGEVRNEDLYQNGVFVVGEDITHIEEDAFETCSDLREVIFLKPVHFNHLPNGYSDIYGIFKTNRNLQSLTFPENQEKIFFPILLNCASELIELHLSEKAHLNLCKDILDYNETAHKKFSTNLIFDIYNKTNDNECKLPISSIVKSDLNSEITKN